MTEIILGAIALIGPLALLALVIMPLATRYQPAIERLLDRYFAWLDRFKSP